MPACYIGVVPGPIIVAAIVNGPPSLPPSLSKQWLICNSSKAQLPALCSRYTCMAEELQHNKSKCKHMKWVMKAERCNTDIMDMHENDFT